MATANTDGFRVLPSYYEVMRDLPDAERLALYDALFDYGFGNEPQALPPLLAGYFRLIKPSLEKSVRFHEKQRENGAKGGRPRKPSENPRETQPKPKGNLDSESAIDIESELPAAKPPRSRFIPPTLEDVRGYCQEQGYSMDPAAFMDYFTANGWKVGGKAPMRDWRAAVRSWERREQQSGTGRPGDETVERRRLPSW